MWHQLLTNTLSLIEYFVHLGIRLSQTFTSSIRSLAPLQETKDDIAADKLIFDTKSGRFYEAKIEELCAEEFCLIDTDSGKSILLTKQEKERIFLDSIQSYYFKGQNGLSDVQFDKLRSVRYRCSFFFSSHPPTIFSFLLFFFPSFFLPFFYFLLSLFIISLSSISFTLSLTRSFFFFHFSLTLSSIPIPISRTCHGRSSISLCYLFFFHFSLSLSPIIIPIPVSRTCHGRDRNL